MPTLEENVAALLAATTALTNTVNVRKSALDTAVSTAQNSATAAAGSLNAVSQINAVANAAATLCAASAQQAATARDLAVAAWGAATAPAETLAAMSTVGHVGNVVKTLIVDTSRDSDGGAWRKKCQALSYYNEPLCGKWLGAFRNGVTAANSDGVLGAPLFTNTFAVDTAGVTAAYQSSIAAVGGKLRVTATGTNPYAQIALTVEAGKAYRVFAVVSRGDTASGNSINMSADNTGTLAGTAYGFDGLSGNTGEPSRKVGLCFVATNTTLRVRFQHGNTPIGSYFEVSDIEIQEVTATRRVDDKDYYQNIADGKFYSVNAAGAQVEVFRGNKAEFPAIPDFKLELGRLGVYDLTQPGCPMWMVFASGATGWDVCNAFVQNAGTSLAYREGKLYIGTSLTGAVEIDFASGRIYALSGANTSGGDYKGGIAERNAGKGYAKNNSRVLVNQAVNDIAATVLADAPTDPATGLLVPTIAVACGSGGSGSVGSVISHSGAVVNYSQAGTDGGSVAFLPNGDVVWGMIQRTAIYAMPLASSNVAAVDVGPGVRSYGVTSTPGLVGISGTNNRRPVAAGGVLASHALQNGNGLHYIKENPSTPALGMVATLSATIPPAWQVGDSRLLALCDTVAETISAGANRVPNGDFSSGLAGWVPQAGALLEVTGGELKVTAVGLTFGGAQQLNIPIAAKKQYQVSFDARKGTSTSAWLVCQSGSNVLNIPVTSTSMTRITRTFYADGASLNLTCQVNNTLDGGTAFFDNINIELAEVDQSVKNNGLNIIGTLTKTLVGGVAMYGGSSLNASGDFLNAVGTTQPIANGLFNSEFGVTFWWDPLPNHDFTLTTVYPGTFPYTNQPATDGHYLGIQGSAGNKALSLNKCVGGTRTQLNGAMPVPVVAGLRLVNICRRGNTLFCYFNDQLVASASVAADTTLDLNGLWFGQSIGASRSAFLRISATAPSVDDIAKMYRDELPMFQPGAVVTLAGSSNAVTALAYDPTTDITHALTSWGRSSFKGFVRVDAEATAVGTPASVSALSGAISTAGSTGARIYMPALTLREELKRKDEARAALHRTPWVIQFDAIAGQTVFALPKGTRPLAVYLEGVLKRVGTTKWYTVTDDGYQKSVKAAVAPGAAAQVDVLVVRE